MISANTKKKLLQN